MSRKNTGGWEDVFDPLLNNEPTPMEVFGNACQKLHQEIVQREQEEQRKKEEEQRLAIAEALRVQLRETTGRAPLSNATTSAVQRLLRATQAIDLATPPRRFPHASDRK